ncbi:hypothetical protein BpHYR1_041379 [Brachionus plicatilis]|uniref:Uncharacterized protein n=1 Tax=Brachionus plicatilis TaxID=10195 RepID=A0A3M7SLG5_BRAPC|nr:hypothetical protein BpHYR1_041379 [Brachionus plicatilis]
MNSAKIFLLFLSKWLENNVGFFGAESSAFFSRRTRLRRRLRLRSHFRGWKCANCWRVSCSSETGLLVDTAQDKSHEDTGVLDRFFISPGINGLKPIRTDDSWGLFDESEWDVLAELVVEDDDDDVG